MRDNTFNAHLRETLVRLGPVFLGVKPGELLNIKEGKSLDSLKINIKGFPNIRFIEVKKFTQLGRVQLFFYNQELMDKTLQQIETLSFLKEMGYPQVFKVENYISEVAKRLTYGQFPHEIGVFLGYPLKDVLGYMGIIPMQLVAIKGWRYYGSCYASYQQYNNFLKAREVTKIFINNFCIL
ncbi:MAG: DUF3793 family protein [Bacillota bacterium]